MTSDFQVGQVASDFTNQAYVVKYLNRVVRQVKKHLTSSDVICECTLSKFQSLYDLCTCHFTRYSVDFTCILYELNCVIVRMPLQKIIRPILRELRLRQRPEVGLGGVRGWMIWRVQYVENHGCRTTAFYRKDYEGVAGKLAPSASMQHGLFVMKIVHKLKIK